MEVFKFDFVTRFQQIKLPLWLNFGNVSNQFSFLSKEFVVSFLQF